MTDPSHSSNGNSRKDFDSLISNSSLEGARRGWILPALTVTLAVLGVAALVGAAILTANADASTGDDEGDGGGSAEPSTSVSSQTSSASATGEADSTETPITELVDAEWLARIAAAGDIPERALAAYAGAAIAVEETHPDCGIGWNTLAAIGLVETEHASIDGATLNDDGTVSPAIIGEALDGTDSDEVADTDGGELDGDTTWDHAVGPMQFIPSTWEQAAQDGNRDGETDVNQIDDAALSAAVYLCEAGGDLTVSENWITAITAYNDSADYNNQVAEAASEYAALE